VQEGTPEAGGSMGMRRFLSTVGGHYLDLQGSFNDFSIGLYETFGKFSPTSSADDWFKSEMILLWHMNPVYTRIALYHFIAEARYNGAEVVNISPDINASHTHADYQVPIKGQRPGVRLPWYRCCSREHRELEVPQRADRLRLPRAP